MEANHESESTSLERPDRDLAAAIRELIDTDARVAAINSGRNADDLKLGQLARFQASRDTELETRIAPIIGREKSRAGLPYKRAQKSLNKANAELGAWVRKEAINDAVLSAFVASVALK